MNYSTIDGEKAVKGVAIAGLVIILFLAALGMGQDNRQDASAQAEESVETETASDMTPDDMMPAEEETEMATADMVEETSPQEAEPSAEMPAETTTETTDDTSEEASNGETETATADMSEEDAVASTAETDATDSTETAASDEAESAASDEAESAASDENATTTAAANDAETTATEEVSSDQWSAEQVAFLDGDPNAGERAWRHCSACHVADETQNRVGPHLVDIIGRDVASIEGFRYSNALKDLQGQAWTPEELDAWLENPRDYAPGTSMSYAGLRNAEDRKNLLAYLYELQQD
ncbi:MAG: hypothetical protein ACEPO2_19775 [Pelagibaca sp.]